MMPGRWKRTSVRAARLVAALGAAILPVSALAQDSSSGSGPAGAAPGSGARPGIRASIEPVLDRLQQEAIEQGAGTDPRNPFRFSTTIEVHAKTPEQLLARFLDGPDTRLARPPHSPPSVRDLDRFRVVQPQPNFLGLAREVARWLGGRGEPHYFLYRVTRDGRTSAVLRETRLPADLLLSSESGAVFEVVDEFASKEEALAAYEDLQKRLAREEEALEAVLEAEGQR